MSLWTAGSIAAATDGTLIGSAHTPVDGVSIDTRTLAKGDLFIALQGPNHDAHDYAENAVKSGASVLLVNRALPVEAVQVVVSDTHRAMEALGMARRAEMTGFVLGITGSVGKTGTKELAAAGFAQLGRTHATQGNLNNHFGVPLTLARMPRDTEFAVIEMGMSAPGEIRDLTRQVRPDAALITWISAAHSAFFANTEEIARAKAEIFEGLPPAGIAAVPADNPFCGLLASLAGQADVRRFGYAEEAEFAVVFDQLEGTNARYRVNGQAAQLALSGQQWGGSIAGLLACLPKDLDAQRFLAGMATVEPLKGRGKLFRIPASGGGTAVLIDESYNASPAAVEAALTLLATAPTQGRRVAVLGDMLELDQQEEEHAQIGRFIANSSVDRVHVSGTYGEATLSQVNPTQRGESAPDPEALYTKLAQSVQDGDIWLIKGSLGSKIHMIVDKLLP